MSTYLCNSLRELAASTWHHMGYALARDMRLPDERAFSEHHSIELGLQHPTLVQVGLYDVHQEATTGADLELWIGDGFEYIATLVQAKKLALTGRYESLDHRVGRGGRLGFQLDRLVAACTTGTYKYHVPLVLMFNGQIQRVRPPADRCGHPTLGDDQRGCSLAHAREILAVARASGRWERRWSSISPVTWPWQCLFCCPALPPYTPPQRRFASMLSGSPGPGGEWRPGALGDSFRLWSSEELPDYVASLATREPEALTTEISPGSSRVVLIRVAEQDSS